MFYRLVRIDAMKGQDEESWVIHLPTTIGRSSEFPVCISDDSISRSHCQLLLGADESLQVRDLGSTNGTYVNGDRVRQTHSLAPGDTLQLGSVLLRVDYRSDTDPGHIPPPRPKPSMAATQPMRTIAPGSFTIDEPPKNRWWEFWKNG